MREILFRGKRADNGEWVEGYLVNARYYLDNSPITIMIPSFSPYSDTFEPTLYPNSEVGEWEEVVPKTVGQYTGLTDKNGKKIFEGDIVKTHYANAQKSDFIETVVFHNGKFCGFYENNGCKQWTTLYDGVPHLAIDKSVYMDSVEVIGNIHDNPELLKGGAGE